MNNKKIKLSKQFICHTIKKNNIFTNKLNKITDFYAYKILRKRNTEKEIQRHSVSINQRNIIVKLETSPKLIYRYNTISIKKFQLLYFRIVKLILNFMVFQDTQNILSKCYQEQREFTLSGEYVISSVLSYHNKNLKQWTLRPLVCHSSRTVLQLCVTVQFYLENKGKYILKA